MAKSILGLLFEIDADPTKAKEALAKLKAASTGAESANILSIITGGLSPAESAGIGKLSFGGRVRTRFRGVRQGS